MEKELIVKTVIKINYVNELIKRFEFGMLVVPNILLIYGWNL